VQHGRFDILPALKREDSPVGRRAVPSVPEGNFLPEGSTGVVSTTSGRWAHNDASPFGLPRLWLYTRPVARTAREATVQTGAFGSALSEGPTRVVPSTELHRTASAEWTPANGARFGMPSSPRLRDRYRPSPVTGRGTVRRANESELRTPGGFATSGRGTVRIGGKRPRCVRLILYVIGLYQGMTPAIVWFSVA
jgi:hypothetical protein